MYNKWSSSLVWHTHTYDMILSSIGRRRGWSTRGIFTLYSVCPYFASCDFYAWSNCIHCHSALMFLTDRHLLKHGSMWYFPVQWRKHPFRPLSLSLSGYFYFFCFDASRTGTTFSCIPRLFLHIHEIQLGQVFSLVMFLHRDRTWQGGGVLLFF